MNTKLLLSVMVMNGDTQASLAEAMGLPQPSLNARIHGKIEFRKNEIQFIKNRYNLSCEMVDKIFFTSDVA